MISVIAQVVDTQVAPWPTSMLVWQTVIGVAMVSANVLVLRIMLKSCREDKAELSAQFAEALKQNGTLVDVAVTLAEEIRRGRDKHRS